MGFQSLDSDQKKKARIHSHFICFCGVLLTWRICNCSLIICISFPFHLDSLSPCTPTYSTQSHSVIKIHRFSRKKSSLFLFFSISFIIMHLRNKWYSQCTYYHYFIYFLQKHSNEENREKKQWRRYFPRILVPLQSKLTVPFAAIESSAPRPCYYHCCFTLLPH